MACACKANQDISYLKKRYGREYGNNKKTNIREDALVYLEKAGFFLLAILLLPFVIFDLLLHVLSNKGVIKITDLFAFKSLKKNVN